MHGERKYLTSLKHKANNVKLTAFPSSIFHAKFPQTFFGKKLCVYREILQSSYMIKLENK